MSEPAIHAVNQPLLIAGGNRISSAATLNMFIEFFASRRGSSMIVRRNVTRQFHDWRDEFGYSFPVVVIDTIWNLAFVAVSVFMLIWTAASEETNIPLSVWICGYSVHCIMHVVLVWKEYKKRSRRMARGLSLDSSDSSSDSSIAYDEPNRAITALVYDHLFLSPKRWENLHTITSYAWWVIGVVGMVSAYKVLLHAAPHLFWLTLVFLALDGCFVAIAILFYCVLGLATGASVPNFSILQKYVVQEFDDEEQPGVRALKLLPMRTNDPDFLNERDLPTQDANCCICLSSYEKGSEIYLLPCNHDFHATCILKWLMLKATCPLCKRIVHTDELF
uniref:E3 ubiquitin protein ligase RIE1-like n=1 Tax=Erigeron canadensis TaxID=72917 RepID=UPI001CB8FA7C|nr:E3 ubiquitin protein ligase RIE1-like [Erigeron canadensis]